MPDATPPAAAMPLPAPARRSARVLWLIALVGFALGIAAVIAALPLVERWRGGAAPAPAQSTPAPTAAPSPAALDASVPVTLAGLTTREATLDARLDAVEARLVQADASSRVAASNASRAERLLIAIIARRELNRGLPLGWIEPQLHSHFDATEPQAVATVVAAARAPVTLEDLRAALDALAPTLATGTLADGVWPAVRREIGNLIVLRRNSTPSPQPNDRLLRARRMLDAGNAEAALAEVARLPGAGAATSWLDAAKRYVEARRALTRLEVAAVRTVTAPQPAPALPGGPAPAPAN